jgi:hypothetical protein
MKNRSLPLVLALGLAKSAAANNFESPEDAVRALEEAYVRRDTDAAVAARDFTEEARRMLVRLGPGLEGEADILKQTAEVLELGYRNELKKSTFRRFEGVRCAITSVVPVEEKLVKVLENCTLKSGQVAEEILFVARTANGWRVITIPAEP